MLPDMDRGQVDATEAHSDWRWYMMVDCSAIKVIVKYFRASHTIRIDPKSAPAAGLTTVSSTPIGQR